MTKLQQVASIFFLFLICFSGYAQYELNPFKYVIVPKQFDFLKSENQYRVNSMTKYLFEKDGYLTFYQGDEYPADLNANPCLALTAFVLNESSVFTTKLYISLKDCRDKEVYRTELGMSKIKDFEKTYIDALKKSFVSIQNLDYSFEEAKVINAGAITAVASEPQKVNPVTTDKEIASQKEIESVTQPDPVKKSTPEPSTEVAAVIPFAVISNEAEAEEKTAVIEEPTIEEPKQEVAEEKAVVAEQTKVEEPAQAVAEEKVAVSEEAVAVAAVAAVETDKKEELSGGARAFKNDTTTFLLVDQGSQMQAFVSESKNKNYKPGELIGTFKKTSLPNVFRVSWKKPQNDIDQTTAYFDDQGNLKIDILRNDKIEVLTFKEVK